MAEERADLIHLLLMAAAAMDVDIVEAVPEWSRDRFSVELLSGVGGQEDRERLENDLPTSFTAIRLDRTPVLVGTLDGPRSREYVQDVLRRYRNQAKIARSWLGADSANLQVFLLGPPGTGDDPVWRQLAAEIETDDGVCRKLVWLPQEPTSVQDAGEFLGRTFVARPWEGASAMAERLDRMSEIALPPGWTDLVFDEALDADTLISGLINLSGEPEP